MSITNDRTPLEDEPYTHALNPSHFRLCQAPGGTLRILLLKVFSMTRPGIKPQYPSYKADALTDITKSMQENSLEQW